MALKNKINLSEKSLAALKSQSILSLSNNCITESELETAHLTYKTWKRGWGILSLPIRLAFLLISPILMWTLMFLGYSTAQFISNEPNSLTHQALAYLADHVITFYKVGISGFTTPIDSLYFISINTLVTASAMSILGFGLSMWLIENKVLDILKRRLHKLTKSDIAEFKCDLPPIKWTHLVTH